MFFDIIWDELFFSGNPSHIKSIGKYNHGLKNGTWSYFEYVGKIKEENYLNGKVTSVYRSHTHFQTADETILERDKKYITDISMKVLKKSVIGMDVLASIKRFETTLPERYKIATGECIFNGVIFEVNDKTNKVINIKRVKI